MGRREERGRERRDERRKGGVWEKRIIGKKGERRNNEGEGGRERRKRKRRGEGNNMEEGREKK